jgi:lipid-A-disaccharide synthase
MNNKKFTIGLIAGEHSGDAMAAKMMLALRQRIPDIEFVGIGGPQMRAVGMHSLFPMEDINVMGIFEVLKHLFKILRIRRAMIQHFRAQPPDIFIGIDAPDFNFPIERVLRQKLKIKTVHYNSPTIWAWRKNRIHRIVQSTDLLLTILPFEAQYYQGFPISVHYIGHPLADEFPAEPNQLDARAELNIPANARVIALLPGSRSNEIDHLGYVFIKAIQQCLIVDPNLIILAPMIDERRRDQFVVVLNSVSECGAMPMCDAIRVLVGQSQLAMRAADCVLLASGTATLEAMLLQRPMVVAYRLSLLTYWLAKWLVKTPYISLPNLIAQKKLVPELIQEDATPEHLSQAVMQQLNADHTTLLEEYRQCRAQLQHNASARAAELIMEILCRSD